MRYHRHSPLPICDSNRRNSHKYKHHNIHFRARAFSSVSNNVARYLAARRFVCQGHAPSTGDIFLLQQKRV